MKKEIILRYLIAAVWFVNGLLCKVWNLVPRHEAIVEKIVGTDSSRLLTISIGLAEVLMAVWIVTRYRSRLNAIVQVIVIGLMNILEFFLAPDLLLWGRWNAVFALLFILLIFYHEFVMKNKPVAQS